MSRSERIDGPGSSSSMTTAAPTARSLMCLAASRSVCPGPIAKTTPDIPSRTCMVLPVAPFPAGMERCGRQVTIASTLTHPMVGVASPRGGSAGAKDRMPGVVRPPLPRRLSLRAVAAIATVGALAVAGCNKDSGDTSRGQQLFNARGGPCHTLAAAGTNGQQGPDLDDAFAAARARGMDSDTIAGVVKAQVEDPRPTVANDPSVSMPAELAEGQDLNDIAAYVGSVAGTGQKPPQLTSEQLFVSSCGSC